MRPFLLVLLLALAGCQQSLSCSRLTLPHYNQKDVDKANAEKVVAVKQGLVWPSFYDNYGTLWAAAKACGAKEAR